MSVNITDDGIYMNNSYIPNSFYEDNIIKYFSNYKVYFYWGNGQDIHNLYALFANNSYQYKYLIFFTNDYNDIIENVPSNFIIYRTGLYKHLRQNYEYIFPCIYCNSIIYSLIDSLEPVLRTNKPKVCFSGSFQTYHERKNWCEFLMNHPSLDTNIIDSGPFRGKPTSFLIDNYKTSEFCFCPRGKGNFSIRFYETLYYSRIPVIIDTDILLPFHNEIDWEKYIVICNNIEELPQKVYDFWLNNDIYQKQIDCKNLYNKYFTNENICQHIYKEISINTENIMNKKYNFYSQLGEDLYVFKHFINNIVTDGIFVELGAMDGNKYSNSKFFEDELGFTGILIEPSIKYNDLIINRPNCKNFNYAIFNKEENVKFIGEDATSGIFDNIPEIMFNMQNLKSCSPYYVPGIPIKNILNKENIKYIDIFFIDVEGGEHFVLESMDWTIPVYIIIIEMHNIDIEKDNYCRNILQNNGFHYFNNICVNEVWINNNYLRKDKLFNVHKKINHLNSLEEIGSFPYIEKSYIPEIINTINA